MNMDYYIPECTDKTLKFELLGEDNRDYEFATSDSLNIHFSDIAKTKIKVDNISLYDFKNPLSYTITKTILSEFTSDPIEFKVILSKANEDLLLVYGNIYR